LAHGTLRIDGAEVGDLRVGARSVQRAGRAIALATIDRALAAPGVPVDVDAGERVLAGVVTRRAGLPSGSAAPNY
jgi:glycine cleavage system aminomethyltransferase T